jgi:transmembrane sensor
MNRYDERQLVLDSAELATVRVSGVYRTGDSPGFARAVAELHGLKVIEGADRIRLQR